MAILEITSKCVVYGETAMNRYHYYSSPLGTPYFDFAREALDDIRLALESSFRALLATNTNVRLREWKVRSLYDPTDFGEVLGLDLAGSAGAQEPIPSNWAVSVRSNRVESGRRRGYKRIGGVGEVDIVGNTLSATAVTRFATYASVLKDVVPVVVTGQSTVFMYPVLLKLQKTLGIGGLPPTYAPFSTEALQRANMMEPTTWGFYAMTSQNTRRPGRGI